MITVWNKAVLRKLNLSLRPVLYVTWFSQKSLWEHRRLIAKWGGLSANLFCAVNDDKRAWALFSSTVQAVIVCSTRSLANVWRGWVIGSRPSQHTKHKCGDSKREKKVSEEELGWGFYHRAIILSLVNTEGKLSTNSWLLYVGKTIAGKRGSCSSHQGQQVWHCFPAGSATEFLQGCRSHYHTGVVTKNT